MWNRWNLLKTFSAFPLAISSVHVHTPHHSSIDTTIHHTMNYLHTAPADLSAFSHWPDALTASEEEIGMWAQLGEYTRPGPDEEGVPLDILDATLAWGTSRTTPAEPFNFEDNVVSIFILRHDRIYTYIRRSLAIGRPEARWPRAVPAIAPLSWTLA